MLVVAACSSSGSSGSPSSQDGSGGNSGGNSAGLASINDLYHEFVAAQSPISVPTLPSKPTAGKSVAIMTCPLPTCANVADPAKTAAQKLGWEAFTVNSPIEPQGYVAAVTQMAQRRPDFAIIIPFFPNTFIAKELAAMQQAGTKIVEIAGGQTPSTSGPVLGETSGTPELSESGRLMGVAVAQDAQGPAHALFVWDPKLASSWEPVMDAFKSVIVGAGGTVDVLGIASSEVGKSVPSQVTSYLQSHQKISYVGFAVSDLATGVPAALKGVGLDSRVKLISRAPTVATMADVSSGAEWATVAEEVEASGYRAIDQLARIDEKIPLGQLINPVGWHQILKKSNLPSSSHTPPRLAYRRRSSSPGISSGGFRRHPDAGSSGRLEGIRSDLGAPLG